jgi:hypothetical protein
LRNSLKDCYDGHGLLLRDVSADSIRLDARPVRFDITLPLAAQIAGAPRIVDSALARDRGRLLSIRDPPASGRMLCDATMRGTGCAIGEEWVS